MAGKDIIKLTDDDYKDNGGKKTAPGGKYAFKPVKKHTKIKPGSKGNVLQLCLEITKGPHKGTYVFDNISASTGWKVAQLLKALGKKKVKKISLQDLMKLALAAKEISAVIKKTMYEGTPQNKVVQLLPPGADTEVDDEDLEDDDDDANEEEEEQDDADESDDEDDDEEEDDDDDEDGDDDSDDEDEDEEDDDADDEDEDEEEEDEDDDDDEDEDEEDEEEEQPTRRRTMKKAAAKKTARGGRKTASKKTTRRGRR